MFAVPLIILVSIGTIFNSADAQNSPIRPQPEPNNNVRRLRLIPLMPPSEAVEYIVIPAGGKITGRLGLPAAKLINFPPELNEVAVWTPPKTQGPPLKPDDVAYELISSVRYRGADKELVIATYRLSLGAAKLERFLGRAETLADGTTAGIKIASLKNNSIGIFTLICNLNPCGCSVSKSLGTP